MKPKKIKFKVMIVIEPDGDRFHAYSPSLKGLHVDGKSIEETKGRARDAVIIYFGALINNGDPIPLGVGNIKKKKKESRIFNLNIDINLRKSSRAIATLKASMKRVAAWLNKWAG